MSTFGTMNTRIATEIFGTSDPSDYSAAINSAIKSAINYYEAEGFWHNQAIAGTVTVPNQEYYAVPDNFVGIDELKVTVNDYTYPLTLRNNEWMNEMFINASTYTNQPTDYSIYEEQFRLYPVPDATLSLTIEYTKSFDDLSATSDTNVWMTKGERLIRFRAKSDLFANVLHNPEMSQSMKTFEYEELDKLRERNNRFRGTPSLKPYL